MTVDHFKRHLRENFGFLFGKRLLVAVSGGLDSMVLTELIKASGFDFALAHCNFKLRGGQSDGDADFVRAYAEKNGLPYFITAFDTKQFAADRKLSLQMAARELRYAWFRELLEVHGFQFVLTAHHADDDIETFFINLSRGSGIDGLSGMPRQNGNVVRPLLAFSRAEIESFASAENIAWREDASNASGDYLRNRIRHELLLALDKLAPSFRASIGQSISHLEQSRLLAADAARIVYREVAVELEDKTLFRIPELKRLPHYHAYLFQWLQPYGFTAWDDIYALVDAPPGRQVFSPTHIIAKDRETLELTARMAANGQDVYHIGADQTHFDGPLKLDLESADRIIKASDSRIFVDRDLIRFPLTLRRWREGDRFQPSGMEGTKKISKYFKDEKFPLSEKAATWLLCSGDDIVWIVGHRADGRFKVTPQTKHILQITAS